ncbi:MAG: hypothetical protein A7316_00980 [Candidatus Altiarchaeales archaeon WOR_SM1_86-2]|nr:MAG: hypothetical protein A7316_00980 [Candidatus Altiarchaeales archaeon WOR_SM1_86-2]
MARIKLKEEELKFLKERTKIPQGLCKKRTKKCKRSDQSTHSAAGKQAERRRRDSRNIRCW